MFFFLSKVLSIFISPFNWLLIFILLAVIIKNAKWKKRLVITSVIWFLFFSNHYIIHKLIVSWQAPVKEFTAGEQYQAGIVLTGFTGFEMNSGRGYFTSASDRFIQTVKLYQQKRIKKIIISGGSGSIDKDRQRFKEADFVKEEMIANGIPEADILAENQSRNTYENAVETKKILDSVQIKSSCLLITSALHMKRSVKVFEKAGTNVVAYPCNYNALNNPQHFGESVIPTYEAFDMWDKYLKEAVGLLIYRLTGRA
ncbi:MAG: YdcF family protein [Sphingobacteriales bacterium]|nr:YdcF family protein [Sphingobacteriales bacterium]MBI3717909.1 YdcF family protein [Sphingobacteriales bacterium]